MGRQDVSSTVTARDEILASCQLMLKLPTDNGVLELFLN